LQDTSSGLLIIQNTPTD